MASLRSMTGFGRAEQTGDLGSMVVEVKSVNQRNLDLRIFLPRELSRFEIPLGRIVRERLSRGKVDVSVQWTPSSNYVPRLSIGRDVLKYYDDEVRNASIHIGRTEEISLEYLLGLPGVTEKTNPTPDEGQLLEFLSKVLEEALKVLEEERAREGQALGRELEMRLDTLERMRQSIAGKAQEVVQAYREKLGKKVEEWSRAFNVPVDPGRMEAEVLYFADRGDITEELVRLQAHVDAFRQALQGEHAEPQGKMMEFMTQEMLRETNTVGSKSRDLSVASVVLGMKNEIEKIREQVMNVE